MNAFFAMCLLLLLPAGLAAETANTKPDDDKLLQSIRVVVDAPQAKVNWIELTEAIDGLGAGKKDEAAPLLILILRRESPLISSEDAPLPGVMPPLEMVQSAAIEALVKLQAGEAAPAIEDLARATKFQLLRERALEALSELR
ncbi:MAG: HEAT repeat domain-containing protein [Candidatus Abyssobacteria bacterium SURF_5]|uniref:HEAT repeat domain-containing protein n=1 Tax=Abyssobacteria bacterium (strain SURF_5) TaxID=2093360 RepID=A0A3A4NC08_ABYX5|nr:MAG: HEAT repeat domain-containing protein [Candidatus Abyssubacteria bacterium SURF_5]